MKQMVSAIAKYLANSTVFCNFRNMSIKWIFFDLGWTLVDESQAHKVRFQKLQKFLSESGIPKSTSGFMADCQKAASEFVSSPFIGAMKSYGLSEEQLSDARRLAPYSKADEFLYEGVPELLRLLAKTHSLGIIANQSAGTLNCLKDWGIEQCFSSVFASAEAGLSKPDPEIFKQALGKAGCSPNEAMMVGDRLDNDIGQQRVLVGGPQEFCKVFLESRKRDQTTNNP